jgi:predicted dehydrogenase
MADEFPFTPSMRTICGRDEGELSKVAQHYGWQKHTTEWEQIVSDPDIHIVVIASPGNTHHEIAIAAAQAGKHILCEKPLSITLAEALEMHRVAEQSRIKAVVNFNYRRIPAVVMAHNLIAEGKLGDIYHFKGVYQQDWPLDADFPYVWRMDKAIAGAGSMADKGSHIVDLARYLVGEFDEVSGTSEIFVKERLLPDGSGRRRTVTTDDAAVFVARFVDGALGVFETSRMSAGHKNGLWFEVNGSKGSLRFELERLNELQVYFTSDPDECQGFRTVMATQPSHPYISYWWPPGHIIGWEHTFIHQYYELMKAIADDTRPSPDFYDGMRCQQVLEAIELAARQKQWVKVSSLTG